MIKIKHDRIVIDRTKTFRIGRVCDEIRSFLNHMNLSVVRGPIPVGREKLIQEQTMKLDVHNSILEWFNQYSEVEQLEIVKTYRFSHPSFQLYQPEFQILIGMLIEVVREKRLQSLLD